MAKNTKDTFYVVECGYAYLQRPIMEGTLEECREYVYGHYMRDGCAIMSIEEYSQRYNEDYDIWEDGPEIGDLEDVLG